MLGTPKAKPCTRDVRYDLALRKGAACEDDMTGLEPLFFTFVVSTFATILSTRVLRIVAKVLTTLTVPPGWDVVEITICCRIDFQDKHGEEDMHLETIHAD
jgi:hypothetical protein